MSNRRPAIFRPPEARLVDLVLQPLVLQPGGEEGLVGIDRPPLELDARRVEAVDQRLVQRRASPAQRIEQPRRTIICHRRGHGQCHVHHQLGELLVGLALIALDGQQVVVEPIAPADLDRLQPVAVQLEQRIGAGQLGHSVRRTRGVEGHVGNAADHRVADPGHAVTEDDRHLRPQEAEDALP